MIKLAVDWTIDIIYFSIVAAVFLATCELVTKYPIDSGLLPSVFLGVVIASIIREVRPHPVLFFNNKGTSHDSNETHFEDSSNGR